MVTVRASQTGDEDFLAAIPVDQTFEVITVTGWSNVNKAEISFYPNPVADELTLDFKNVQVKEVLLYDLQGNVIIRKADEFRKLNTSHLRKGAYILRVRTENGTTSSQILKQ